MRGRRILYTPEAQEYFPETEEYWPRSLPPRIGDRVEIPEWPGTEEAEFSVVRVTDSVVLVGVSHAGRQ